MEFRANSEFTLNGASTSAAPAAERFASWEKNLLLFMEYCHAPFLTLTIS